MNGGDEEREYREREEDGDADGTEVGSALDIGAESGCKLMGLAFFATK